MVNYRVADLPSEKVTAELREYPPILRQLLFTRGITTKAKAEAFLEPSYTDTNDPWLMPNIKTAVLRILEAFKKQERIGIFSDYDCDGIPGAVILHDLFKAIGYDNFVNYIPHRHYEGFGFSAEAAEKLAAKDVKLIITIDCGTTNHEAIEKAKQLGVDTIITDHHEPRFGKNGKPDLPKATAVVNPKLDDTYPFPSLCGAAVVFKLAEAVIEAGQKEGLFTLTAGWEKWWLDMVGIATIADMVPLTGENRILAHYGLHVLRKSRRPGLQQLLRKQRVEQRFLSEDDIGFTIGPRINAASRMDTPEDAFHLLSATDEGEAGARVAHLEKLNNDRRGQVAAMTKEAHKRLKDTIDIPPILVLGNPNWRPALVGLVANKLAEEYSRPAFLWGRDGNGYFKGSCRSDGRISVVSLMEAVADHFSEHGGHHQSGGFSIKETHIHTFSQSLISAYQRLGEIALVDNQILADYSLSINDFDQDLLDIQKRLAPFGVDNKKPIYEIVDVLVNQVQIFGKNNEHTKLIFEAQGLVKEGITFFRLPEQFTTTPRAGYQYTLLAHLEESYFMGRKQIRLRIVDIF